MSITLKTPAEVALIRKAGLIHAKILNEVGRMVKPGISTGELNAFAEKRCAEEKVLPAFKGYQGFPAALCTSVNNQVVHTIPSYKQILEEGDIVAIDFGVTFAGWHADACMTFAVGKISKEAQQLMDATKASLYLAIAQAKAGNTTGDIGNAIESYVKKFGFTPVRETVGHGIGRHLHEDPEVPNWGKPHTGDLLRAGMVICIEPIINVGGSAIVTENDGWTTHTRDGSLSAQFEHQVLITDGEAEILTPWDR